MSRMRRPSIAPCSAGITGRRTPAPAGIPNHWKVYFAVNDAAESIEVTRAGGGTVLREAREAEGVGVIASLADPYGAPFFIIQLALEID